MKYLKSDHADYWKLSCSFLVFRLVFVPAPFVPACHTCLPPVHGDDVPWDRAGLKDERGLCAEPKCLTELTFRSARGSMLCVLPDCNDDAPRVARRETRVG